MSKSKINWLLKQEKKKLKIPKTPTQKKNYVERQAKKMYWNPTGPEIQLGLILDELNIYHFSQKIVKDKIFDYYIPKINLLIEVDGDYWHGYGKEYSELNEVQKKSQRNDRDKDILAKGLGYDIIRFWEHDIYDNPDFIKSELLKKIN
jgi:very-short-patch-repair endonuclease